VSLKAIGTADKSIGRLEAYNTAGQLVARVTTGELAADQAATMTIQRGSNDISYVLAFGIGGSEVRLDSMSYGADTSVQTGQQGQYALPALPPGQYTVRVSPASGWESVTPGGGQATATVVAGQATSDIDFGFVQMVSAWQNQDNPVDVNDSGTVTPIDALLVINQLNANINRLLSESGLTAPPYIDVNGDGRLSPVDALLVINYLNERAGSGGEGELTPPWGALSIDHDWQRMDQVWGDEQLTDLLTDGINGSASRGLLGYRLRSKRP
jgi:hypothetical protein